MAGSQHQEYDSSDDDMVFVVGRMHVAQPIPPKDAGTTCKTYDLRRRRTSSQSDAVSTNPCEHKRKETAENVECGPCPRNLHDSQHIIEPNDIAGFTTGDKIEKDVVEPNPSSFPSIERTGIVTDSLEILVSSSDNLPCPLTEEKKTKSGVGIEFNRPVSRRKSRCRTKLENNVAYKDVNLAKTLESKTLPTAIDHDIKEGSKKVLGNTTAMVTDRTLRQKGPSSYNEDDTGSKTSSDKIYSDKQNTNTKTEVALSCRVENVVTTALTGDNTSKRVNNAASVGLGTDVRMGRTRTPRGTPKQCSPKNSNPAVEQDSRVSDKGRTPRSSRGKLHSKGRTRNILTKEEKNLEKPPIDPSKMNGIQNKGVEHSELTLDDQMICRQKKSSSSSSLIGNKSCSEPTANVKGIPRVDTSQNSSSKNAKVLKYVPSNSSSGESGSEEMSKKIGVRKRSTKTRLRTNKKYKKVDVHDGSSSEEQELVVGARSKEKTGLVQLHSCPPSTSKTDNRLSRRPTDEAAVDQGKEYAAASTLTVSQCVSEADSDEELIDPSLERDEYEYDVGDLVWAKHRWSPFWPAVVKEVLPGRQTKITVEYFNAGSDIFTCQYSIRAIRQFSLENKRIMTEGYNSQQSESFKVAIKHAMEYLEKRGDHDLFGNIQTII